MGVHHRLLPLLKLRLDLLTPLLPKLLGLFSCLVFLPEERNVLEPTPDPVARLLLLRLLRALLLVALRRLPVVLKVRRFLTAAGGAL